MKKIASLFVSLLLLNVSWLMGMNQLTIKSESKVPLSSLEKSSRQLKNMTKACGKFLVSTMSIAPTLASQDYIQITMGDNARRALQVLHIMQYLGCGYEFWNAAQVPQSTLSQKKRMLLAASFVGTAISWASIMDDCPSHAPSDCIQFRQFFCLLNLIVAGLCFHEASLNK